MQRTSNTNLFISALRNWIIVFFLVLLSNHAWTQDTDKTIVEEVKQENVDVDEDEDDADDEVYSWKKTSEQDQLPVKLRKVPADKIKEMKDQKAFWYADFVFEEEEKKFDNGKRFTPLMQREWFQALLWVLVIACFATFLGIYLAGNNVGLFRKRDRTFQKEAEEEMSTADIFSINYQKEIERAASQGNFRLAIRLMYLQILKDLSERNIISYTENKTNFDYLLQLHPTKYYPDFFRITRHYEYSWYGHFDVNEDAYQRIRGDVEKFDSTFK